MAAQTGLQRASRSPVTRQPMSRRLAVVDLEFLLGLKSPRVRKDAYSNNAYFNACSNSAYLNHAYWSS